MSLGERAVDRGESLSERPRVRGEVGAVAGVAAGQDVAVRRIGQGLKEDGVVGSIDAPAPVQLRGHAGACENLVQFHVDVDAGLDTAEHLHQQLVGEKHRRVGLLAREAPGRQTGGDGPGGLEAGGAAAQRLEEHGAVVACVHGGFAVAQHQWDQVVLPTAVGEGHLQHRGQQARVVYLDSLPGPGSRHGPSAAREPPLLGGEVPQQVAELLVGHRGVTWRMWAGRPG